MTDIEVIPCTSCFIKFFQDVFFHYSANKQRFSENLGYKYDAKLNKRFPADTMLEQG
jgi:hypothetical protein